MQQKQKRNIQPCEDLISFNPCVIQTLTVRSSYLWGLSSKLYSKSIYLFAEQGVST